MSKAKNHNNGGNVLAYILSVIFLSGVAFATWMLLDVLGAMFRTAVQAFCDSGVVQNYVTLKKATSYVAHGILRAVITALVYLKFKSKLKKIPSNVVLRMIIFGLMLESLEFSAYLLEFMAVAVWNALVSVFNSVEVPNILKFGYFDTLDPLARFFQAFVCTNVWFICVSQRVTHRSTVSRDEVGERAYCGEEHVNRTYNHSSKERRLFNSTIEGTVSAPPRSERMQ